MKKMIVTLMVAVGFCASTRAGDLVVDGNVTVASNLTVIGTLIGVNASNITNGVLPESVLPAQGPWIGKLDNPYTPNTSFTTSTNEGTIAITGYVGVSTVVSIPPHIEGFPVTSIGPSAFYEFVSLASVSIPATVASIGDSAFNNCTSLSNVFFQGNAPTLGDNAFANVPGTVWYYSGNTGFGASFGGLPTAIYGPKVAASVILNGVTNTPDSHGAISLTALAPDGNGASLTGITAAQVEAVGTNDSRLSDARVPLAHTQAWTTITGLGSAATSAAEAFQPAGAYLTAETDSDALAKLSVHTNDPIIHVTSADKANWNGKLDNIFTPNSEFTTTTNAGAITISGYIGAGTVILIPPFLEGMAVTSIGNAVFDGRSGLTGVTIPDSVASIGDAAFNNCTSLSNVFFKGNAPSLGNNAFSGVPGTVWYYSGNTGFGASFGGLPTAIYGPKVTASIILNGVTNTPNSHGAISLTALAPDGNGASLSGITADQVGAIESSDGVASNLTLAGQVTLSENIVFIILPQGDLSMGVFTNGPAQ